MIRNESHGGLFPPIKVIQSFLGVEVGTILKFDKASSKYVNVVEGVEEDESGANYYYSGHAIALDPYLVEDNPDYFRPFLDEKPVTKADVEAAVANETRKPPLGVTVKQVDIIADDEFQRDKPQEESLKDEKVQSGDLTFECGLCHTNNFIHKMKYGLFFPVSKDTKLLLKCSNCGIETTVFYELN
jgi:hypothetical protein